MATMTEQVERTLTRPWGAAAVVAALFVAAQGVWRAISTWVFFPVPWGDPGGQGSIRWEIVRAEWGADLGYAIVGVAAGYVLWRAASAGIAHAYAPLLARAVLLYLPVSLVLNLVIGYVWALVHGDPMVFFGFRLLS